MSSAPTSSSARQQGDDNGGASSLRVDPLKVGACFSSSKDLRTAAERVLLSQGRTMVCDHRITGSKSKLYRCAGAIITKNVKGVTGCQVHVRAYKRVNNEWRITQCDFVHENCAGGKKKPSFRALAAEAAVVVNANRKITSGELVKALKGTFGVELKPYTANRLKRQVVGVSEEALNEGYQRLDSYLTKLAEGSPGTVVDCQFDEQGRFTRCFVMLGAVAHFACRGVQQVCSLDFAPLKGEWNGTMGTLSFKDANNKLIRVATCITEKETEDAYRYLIANALKFPPLASTLNKSTTTIFTDKHKGSGVAIPELLSESEHLRCLEHLLKNGGAVGSDGRDFSYQAARAPDKDTCEKYLGKIKALHPVAGQKLAETPHNTWAMYASRGNVVWDQVTSNMLETTNSMIGVETRAKSVLDLVQDIVTQSSSSLAAAATLKPNDPIATVVPFALATFNAEFTWANKCRVSATGGGGYLVFPEKNRRHYNVVRLIFKDTPTDHVYSCTCGWCKRWLIPCRHIIAAAKANDEHEKTLELIDKGYLLAEYRAAASDPRYRIVPPVWASLTADPAHLAPSPVEGQAGRKRGVRAHKRRAGNGEFNTSSRTYTLHVAAAANSQADATQSLSHSQAGATQSLSQGPSQGTALTVDI